VPSKNKRKKRAAPQSEFLCLRTIEDFGGNMASPKLRGQARKLARELNISPKKALERILEKLRRASLSRKQQLQYRLKKIITRPLDKKRIQESKEPERRTSLPENPYKLRGPILLAGLPSLGKRR
jgi:hypothetical protein